MFDFEVNYLFITAISNNNYGLIGRQNAFSLMMSRFFSNNNNYIGNNYYVSDNFYYTPNGWFEQNTFYWYNTAKGYSADNIAEAQANKTGQIYYYVAF